ncbi:hypothetical protein EYD45_07225 [Hyunsoonleella flava]|uniref:LVIVD repeat-containing protein n=1 Tax=Hyunsoonleella flava TaxID=2527939 RepID=A0A4Q9FDZ0_9FLAO|nr:hypothetical protein [Hyunsoonleella flava]TBN04402.1 hypothetical protein EYD45_07225 [Hyunsoonleella flava]
MKKLIYILFVFALLACENDSNSSNEAVSDVGQGGSLATFTILNDYLYTVDNRSLNVFNISTKTNPVLVNRVPIGFNIETLVSYKDFLYIGSRNGMFIYETSNPESPKQLSAVQHFTACDPVIANDTHAFVTLDTSAGCGNTISALQIYDVKDVTKPVLISQRNLIAPKGLGLYGSYLFVCDDEVKVFDISDPENSKLAHSIDISAFDVIIQNNHLIAVGDNQLNQYALDTNDIKNTPLLSNISI